VVARRTFLKYAASIVRDVHWGVDWARLPELELVVETGDGHPDLGAVAIGGESCGQGAAIPLDDDVR
jgi:hypothetical protein